MIVPKRWVSDLLRAEAEQQVRSDAMAAALHRAAFEAEQRGEDTVVFTRYDSDGPVSTGLPTEG